MCLEIGHEFLDEFGVKLRVFVSLSLTEQLGDGWILPLQSLAPIYPVARNRLSLILMPSSTPQVCLGIVRQASSFRHAACQIELDQRRDVRSSRIP